MLFKKSYTELVQDSLSYLTSNTQITNANVGGITRSLLEIINKNIADYYDVLDINMAMGFLSSSEGYYLDLIGSLFNMPRIQATSATQSVSDNVQKFYVSNGTLFAKIPSGIIPEGTIVSSVDGVIAYAVSEDTSFSTSATEVYVPITSQMVGSKYNVGVNILTVNSLGVSGVFTTNSKPIVSGTDTELDENYRYRLMNATVSAERANEISVRLAALSVDNVADVIIRPYARGIGTFDIIVIPVQGIASDSLIASVQSAVDAVKAVGIKATAIKPSIVPVNIEVSLVFVDNVTDYEKSQIRAEVKSAIENYIVSIPIGGTFIFNEMNQQIMDVSEKIKDNVVTCYYFRNQPTFHGNVSIYWDEIFYPDPSLSDAISVV
jgi:uncharacterized phage protein gp47/JayE